MNKLDLNCLPIFIAVVESGNFTAASELLHVTRSAVSKSISRLENSLGVALFQRTTRQQVLTDDGMVLYEYASKALNSLQEASNFLESGKRHVEGKVCITAPRLLGNLYVIPLLIELMNLYPKLEIETLLNDRKMDLQQEGIHIAVRVGKLPDSNQLIAHEVGHHKMILCASPGYLTKNGIPQKISELNSHQLIAYTQVGQVLPWQLYDDHQQEYLYLPTSKFMMDDMQAIMSAVLQGGGIAYLPQWLVQTHIQSGSLKTVLSEYQSASYPISVVWLTTPFLPLKIRVVIDTIREKLPLILMSG
ncbi:D-malate degradation protein R [Providencia rustigianii]|uniref:LysR family transcriptional regulator n=1 Tax=Providencia TaxID=586 RepID=UPI000D9BED70|nr:MULTISPECIES: LysR family transcriptional regulator [Providencia]MTC58333.1 LysR family transcriptional regulator [Providencia rustigianii]SPY76712.1 D-malate degradation protein R [Providencia rustigianii]VEB64171.1 D-malate degradation protein R [Providencia rustigianii]